MDEKRKKKILLVIIFTIFVDILGVGILIPVFPLLLGDPTSPYYLLNSAMGVSQGYIMLGFLSAIFPVMVFFMAPIFGELSDKYGRKKVLAFSLAGTALSYALFAIGIMTKNIPLLFFSRALDGITGSSIVAAQASIADITSPENRAKNFGLIGAAFGFGFIIGPFLGGKLSDPSVLSWFNATTPFWFAGILSVLNVLFIMLVFRETNLTPNIKLKITFTKAFTNIFRAFKMQDIRSLLLTNFFLQGGFTFFTSFFAVYLAEHFHFTQGNTGDYFAYVGFWAIIAQAVVLPFISKRFKEYEILRYSLLFISIFIFANLLPKHVWQLMLITPLFSIANGLSGANLSALISRSADQKSQGEILGISASVSSLAQSFPPILSGFIAAKFMPEATVLVASIVVFFAWLSFVLFFKPKTECEWKSEDCV